MGSGCNRRRQHGQKANTQDGLGLSVLLVLGLMVWLLFWVCCLNFMREWPNGFEGFGAWLLASGSMAAEHCMAWLHGFEAVFQCMGSMKEKHNIAWDGQMHGSLEHNAWVGLYCYSEHGHMAFGLWVLGSGFC